MSRAVLVAQGAIRPVDDAHWMWVTFFPSAGDGRAGRVTVSTERMERVYGYDNHGRPVSQWRTPEAAREWSLPRGFALELCELSEDLLTGAGVYLVQVLMYPSRKGRWPLEITDSKEVLVGINTAQTFCFEGFKHFTGYFGSRRELPRWWQVRRHRVGSIS